MSLIGVGENFCGGPAVVMPFMANGSVLDYLKREQKSSVQGAVAENSMHSVYIRVPAKPLADCFASFG